MPAAALVALAFALVVTPVARADVFGPDESIAQAGGPLQQGVTYTGAFSSADDVDYLSFDVTQPGQTLHFDVVNTLTSCNNIDNDYCPMWATLVDSNGNQLGGEGSTAGTGEVDYASSDGIDWTFANPGRYYLALDSSGDLPTFHLQYGVGAPSTTVTACAASSGNGHGGGAGHGGGGGHGGAGGCTVQSGAQTLAKPGALISSIVVARHQHGRRPSAVLTLTQPLVKLDIQVLARKQAGRPMAVVGHLLRQHPIAGSERVRVTINGAWLSRARRAVPMLFRIGALSLDGRRQTVQRHFTLRR